MNIKVLIFEFFSVDGLVLTVMSLSEVWGKVWELYKWSKNLKKVSDPGIFSLPGLIGFSSCDLFYLKTF